jgi:hypothetical protein
MDRGQGSAANMADVGDHGMGTVVKFPDEGRIVRFGRAEAAEASATVIILPVIRIERHADQITETAEPRTHPPANSGGNRRVRRR